VTLLKFRKQRDAKNRACRPGHAYDDPSHPQITPALCAISAAVGQRKRIHGHGAANIIKRDYGRQ
jgi:hypothetical protein